MNKRVVCYAGFTKPKNFDRNLIVIGAGAGGLVKRLHCSVVKANQWTLIESQINGRRLP